MSGNLLFNVQNHSFLSGLQEFHSIGEWNFHSFTFREYVPRVKSNRARANAYAQYNYTELTIYAVRIHDTFSCQK